ncbi:MAG: class I SAM-dependent methyltransferase [Candidatus Dadabacteria bacterium]|nr:class I SAM-dependent methyltransferase [Candidatus Dadabacteria bacterium]
MKTPPGRKSTLDEIKARFDADVERFSNLETGQQAVLDAPLMLELISRTAAGVKPDAVNLLDIGSGAGNNTIAILRLLPGLDCDLVDLSLPMLGRARERLARENVGEVRIFHGDFRDADLPSLHYDIVVAAAVLHHLRDDADWESTFRKIHALMKPGGVFLVSDMVWSGSPALHAIEWERYGTYLESLGGAEYREKVFAYIDVEDTPRSLPYQLDLLKRCGFKETDVLHKNACFAAYAGIK